ncbi:MAG: ABC transporter substrate-binding protein [Firmicutes bacterium HGW-Firmicutes-21]|nr:MAG: ABC transporter substrate-binding protein [Firmicutes bacterium HGW-Firmicutes-21]
MKKIKLLTLLLAVLLIVPFVLAGCNTDKDETSSADTASVSETESVADTTSDESEPEDAFTVPASIKAAGKIIMATNANFPPYEFVDDDGKYAGIDVEIMQAIADLWEVELVIDNMEFSSILSSIQTGKADVGVAGMTITQERLNSVNFSHTYATATQVIIVKTDSQINGADDLVGKKVGVQLGTTGDIYATDDSLIGAVERYNNGVDAVLALTQGKIDAVIIDNEPAKVFLAQTEGIRIIDEAYTDEEYAIAIAKDKTELRDAINEALIILDENGTLQSIIDKFIKAE